MESLNGVDYHTKGEMVMGLVCAVGVDYEQCLHVLEAKLSKLGYETRLISASSMMDNLAHKRKIRGMPNGAGEGNRIRERMRMGNELRADLGNNVMGLVAIQNINQYALDRNMGERKPCLGTVHIISTMKRSEEIEILRGTYGAGFYLIGLHDTEQGRLEYLTERKGIPLAEAQKLMRDDQEDESDSGQRTRDAYHLADVFASLEDKQYKTQLERFIELLLSHPYHTPTRDEHAMFMAYAASLKSSQLGRQVGAAVVSHLGDVVAVGCNDVPKPGGGQYSCEDAMDHLTCSPKTVPVEAGVSLVL